MSSSIIFIMEKIKILSSAEELIWILEITFWQKWFIAGILQVSVWGFKLNLYQITKFYTCPNWNHMLAWKWMWLKIEIQGQESRKHCRKGRKCWLQSFSLFPTIFSSPEHKVLRMSYCDHSPSVGVRCLSVVHSHFLVYTLASTNINQSAPNLVQMYMTIRSQMSLIMDLIRPELFGLSAFELENLPHLTLFTL